MLTRGILSTNSRKTILFFLFYLCCRVTWIIVTMNPNMGAKTFKMNLKMIKLKHDQLETEETVTKQKT